MQHSEIIQKWLGKRYQETARLGYQCVAWAKKYIFEAYNLRIGPFGGSALTGWLNTSSTFSSEKFLKCEYKDGMVPPAGAVIFWGKTANNPYGHVAIVDTGSTTQKFVIVEQNGQYGSGQGINGDEIRKITISPNARGRCLGWYTYQNNPPKNNYQKILEDEMKDSPEYSPVFKEHDEIKTVMEIGFLRFWKKYIKK